MSEQSINESSTPKKKDTIFKIKQSPNVKQVEDSTKNDSPIKIVEDSTSPERKKRKIIISKSKLAVATGPKKDTDVNKNLEESNNKRIKTTRVEDEFEDDIDMDIEDELESDNDDIDIETENKPLSKSKMTSRQRAMVYGEIDEPLLALENYKENISTKTKKSTKVKNHSDKGQPSAASLKEIYEVINQLLMRQSEKKEKVEVQEKPTFNENYIRVISNNDGKYVCFPVDIYEKVFENWSKPVKIEKDKQDE